MSEPQQPWSDEHQQHGRIRLLSDNPISRAIAPIAEAVGREVHVEEGVDVRTLHVPAGHHLGGEAAGEIALSVVAEHVAERHDRPGGPMSD